MAITTYTKTTPIGIDVPIQKCQNRLADSSTGLSWASADIYGRLYLNKNKDKEITAEAHKSGSEYRDIFVNDKLAGVIGFVVDTNRDSMKGTQKCNVTLVCSVKLDKIYLNATERKDEEALQEVLRILHSIGGWTIKDMIAGNIDDVFTFMSTKKITFRDMQPYANFSIKCSVNYNNNICKIL